MSVAYQHAREPSYLDVDRRLVSWLTTTDHKRIAILYLLSITAFFALGGLAASVIRLELFTPAGDLVDADTYDRFFTIHGIVMVWFFLIPSIPSVFGNFLLPIMIGAKDMAFPRLNLLSWYIYVLGGLFTVATIVAGGVDTGWTFYTPYSTMYTSSAVILAATGVIVVGFSSVLTGLNFLVTTASLRAPGMTWMRLPLFVWAMIATGLILVLATPVLTSVLALVALERIFGVGVFDPAIGGDPLLFQHLFWFYSHPAVYIMVLPAMGVVSELVTCFARRRIFGYRAMTLAIFGIAIVGFLVWGHHMFVSGQSGAASTAFSALSFLVAVPSAVKVFNWVTTLYKGRIRLDAPMLYAFGFLAMFTIGGLTGIMLAHLGIDVHVHDTAFVVSHFHFIMVGGSVMAYLGAIHFWWPKMTGRRYPERPARWAAVLLLLGFLVTFLPQFVVGYLGEPRRVHSYPPELAIWNQISTVGAVVLAVAYLMPLVYLLRTLFHPADAGPNPWGAKGLEWTIPSPPPKENFSAPPVVEEPYAY